MTDSMILYVVTNNTTGFQYVGATSRPLAVRWREHIRNAEAGRGWALHDALRQYGPDAFSVAVVATAESWDDLCQQETALIVRLGCLVPGGYNITTGGEGCPGRKMPAEVRAKISKAHLGKTLTAEHRAKLSLSKQGVKMPPRSAEHRAKIAEGLRKAWVRRKDK
jgi:group I intron endonuclease